jgi:uncharacterized cupin superfamily protein
VEPLNIFDAELPSESAAERPKGFRRLHTSIGQSIGASLIGATLYELPPGERTSPYHYEYNNEEWLLVIEGRPTLRTPGGERDLRPGDLVAFPDGPEGAHGVKNSTDDRVRLLMLSTKRSPAVAGYPDSDKIAVWRMGEDGFIAHRSAIAGYWDGEIANPS